MHVLPQAPQLPCFGIVIRVPRRSVAGLRMRDGTVRWFADRRVRGLDPRAVAAVASLRRPLRASDQASHPSWLGEALQIRNQGRRLRCGRNPWTRFPLLHQLLRLRSCLSFHRDPAIIRSLPATKAVGAHPVLDNLLGGAQLSFRAIRSASTWRK